jgi:hypothetical protein
MRRPRLCLPHRALTKEGVRVCLCVCVCRCVWCAMQSPVLGQLTRAHGVLQSELTWRRNRLLSPALIFEHPPLAAYCQKYREDKDPAWTEKHPLQPPAANLATREQAKIPGSLSSSQVAFSR